MTQKWDIPFNVFAWSLAVFLLFALTQSVAVATLVFAGSSASPFLTFFTWAAISGAIAFGLLSRHSASLRDLLIVQCFACFYLLAMAVAMIARKGEPFSISTALHLVFSIAAFFASGTAGIAVARAIRDRAQAS